MLRSHFSMQYNYLRATGITYLLLGDTLGRFIKRAGALLRMAIITITGTPGSGKSTLAKRLAKHLGYDHFSMGDLQRELATKQGWTINELNEANRKGAFDTDTDVDMYQQQLGEERDDFVIDSRLGFHFIPQSIKLFVDAGPKERARRLHKRGSESDKARNIAHAEELNRQRIENEKERYTKRYGVHPYKREQYDLILDSTHASPEKLVEEILEKFPELKEKGYTTFGCSLEEEDF